MYVIVTYDVATSTEGGAKRLRRVAKACLDYGQRVQFSVFECQVNPAQLTKLKDRLLKIINDDHDSVRFYLLGENWERRVEHHGAKTGYNVDGPLII